MDSGTKINRPATSANPYAIEQPSRFFSKVFRLDSEPAFFSMAVPEQVGLGMSQHHRLFLLLGIAHSRLELINSDSLRISLTRSRFYALTGRTANRSRSISVQAQ
jgi:hypothetical protein